MAFIEWSIDLEVGIGAVDLEHRALVEAVNELQAAVESGEPRNQLITLVARVAREARAHFISEESAMIGAGYPGVVLHSLKHQHIAGQIDVFLARYSRDTSSLNVHLLNFVRDTIVLHIQKEDSNFGRWMLERDSQSTRLAG